VAQLRAKLELDPDRPIHFLTVRGSGYRFVPA
jgi:DNA-binding response OmpR family regulator